MLQSEIKRLARGFLIYGIGGILQKFLGLLLLPFFTRALSPEEYGVMALIGLVSVGLSGLFNLGTGNSMGILYFREEDKHRRPIIIWSNAVLLLVNCSLLSAVFMILAPQMSVWVFESPRYAELFRFSILILALATITEPFYAVLRMEEEAKSYVVLTLVSTAVVTGLSMVFVLGFEWGVRGFYIATLLGQLIVLGIVGAVVARKLPFGINARLFIPLVRIGLPSVLGLFAFLLIDYGDRQLIQRILGLEQLGIYSIGYSFGMVMLVFVGAFGAAWPPFFMSFINRREDAKELFGRVLKYYLVGFGLLTVCFFAIARPAISLWVAPEFHSAVPVVGLVTAAYMAKGCYLILLPGIYFAGRLYLQSGIEWIAAAINIALNVWWIPEWGIVGAAAATLVGYIALPVMAWVVARKYLSVNYDWPRIGSAIISMGASSELILLVGGGSSLIMASALSALSVGALAVFFFFVILERSERQLVIKKSKAILERRQ